MNLKELCKMILKNKEFLFGYSDIFLEVIINEILEIENSKEKIKTILTILSLAKR